MTKRYWGRGSILSQICVICHYVLFLSDMLTLENSLVRASIRIGIIIRLAFAGDIDVRDIADTLA
jgi:hypothetical protein